MKRADRRNSENGGKQMTDLMISIVVVVCVGVFIIAIFAVIRARRQKNEQALAEYCQSRGYSYNKLREPLRVELRIEGDSFSLTSIMASLRHEEQTGSASWDKKTVWATRGGNSAWSSFTLGSIPATGNWEQLPDWIKHAAMEKLMHESGIILQTGNVQPLHITGKSTYLLFEQIPGESRDTIQRLSPLLSEWPAQYKLVIHSGPAEIRIHVADCFIQDAELLEKLVRLGAAAGGM